MQDRARPHCNHAPEVYRNKQVQALNCTYTGKNGETLVRARWRRVEARHLRGGLGLALGVLLGFDVNSRFCALPVRRFRCFSMHDNHAERCLPTFFGPRLRHEDCKDNLLAALLHNCRNPSCLQDGIKSGRTLSVARARMSHSCPRALDTGHDGHKTHT